MRCTSLIPLTLSACLAASCGGTEVPPPPPADATFVDAASQKGIGLKLAADATGRLHAAFTEPSFAPGALGVWYATCAADCGKLAAWSAVQVGHAGTQGGSVDVVVDSAGRVRLAWVEENVDGSRFATAACESGCGEAAGWTAQKPLWSVKSALPSSGYLAWGPGGALGLAWQDTTAGHAGLFLSTCTAACDELASWTELKLPNATTLEDPELAWDPAGRARLAANDTATGYVFYTACDAGCSEADAGGVATHWSDPVKLYALGGGGSYALRLDADGRPRLALAQGDLGAQNQGGFVFLAWCDAGCAVAVGAAGSGWGARTLGLPIHVGANGVDLALGADGKILIALGWSAQGSGVGVATCTSACTTFAPVWTAAYIESAAQLAQAASRPLPAGFDGASWLTVGRAPSLALDAAGTPWLGYGAEHARWKTSQLPAYEYDELRVRVARGR